MQKEEKVIEEKENEPPKKKRKTDTKKNEAKVIKDLQSLYKKKETAVRKLKKKQEKDMKKLTDPFDKKLKVLKEKMLNDDNNKKMTSNICSVCYEVSSEKYSTVKECCDDDCEWGVCENCGVLCDGECENIFCPSCAFKGECFDENMEGCCGETLCRIDGCLAMHRNVTQCLWR